MSTTTKDVEQPRVMKEMSFLDRWLPVWILAAMAVGLLLGRFVPGLNTALEAVKIGSVSLPIAIGLLVMMYPVLAKVRYDETRRIGADRRLLVTSLVLNWIVGPALMFGLAWIFLADLPEYRTGLIIVGLARCIAMVLIWNDLACGDREAAAVLVAINSVFQVIAFGALGWFYLQALPSWLGLPTTSAEFSIGAIVLSVLIFLGIPLVAGFLTRVLGERAKGRTCTRSVSSRRSDRGRCTGCCSPSCCCSLSRATRSSPPRETWPASLCRCWSTSWSCSWGPSCSDGRSA